MAAVVGVGHSDVYRTDEIPLAALAVDAIERAVDDAGLEIGDIDGLSTTPYQPFGVGPPYDSSPGAGDVDGINYVSPEFVHRALRLDLSWAERQLRPLGASFINTVHAVASGDCATAICFRVLSNPVTGRYGYSDATHAAGSAQFRQPYGLTPPAAYALYATEHMKRYGSRREELGQFVVRNRESALNWEYGYWYKRGAQALTLEEYMAARMVSWPLALLDCDLPVQTAAAFVVTTAERASSLRHPPVYIWGTANPFTDKREMQLSLSDYVDEGRQIARHLWSNAHVSPSEVDVVNLYDGFSILTPLWAEALGLCAEGEGFAFVASPNVPLNTSSGSLGAGRTHGIGHIMDSVLQLQQRAGARQIPGAEIALAATNPCDRGTAFIFGDRPPP